MRTFVFSVLTVLVLLSLVVFYPHSKNYKTFEISSLDENEVEASYSRERAKYEFDMLKDPKTGQIPRDIFEKELLFAKGLPVRENSGIQYRMDALNNYIPAGPNNV